MRPNIHTLYMSVSTLSLNVFGLGVIFFMIHSFSLLCGALGGRPG